MKKYVILPLTLMLLGCNAGEKTNNITETRSEAVVSQSADTLFYTNGLELISNLDQMAESQEYRKLFSATEELDTTISDMGKNDYSTPEKLYKISEMEINQNNFDASKLTENLQQNIENKMFGAVPTVLNSSAGTQTVAASSIVADSKYFICADATEPCLYLYVYDGDYSSMVSFIPHDENIISASGCFVANSALDDTSSTEAIKNAISKTGYVTSCKVEEITQ